jgi:DNA-binding IclR family transcriptional regulator
MKSAYHLGLKLVEFGLIASTHFNIQQVAEYELIEFQNKTKQSVIMAVKLEDEILYVFSKENEQGLKFSSTVGQRRPITYGLLGPILLAYSPQSQIDRVLSFPIHPQTPYTIIDKDKWYQKLENIRNEKSYIDINFTTIGVAGIGAPIFGVDQNVIAALGVMGPIVQVEDKLEEFKELISETVDKISRKMRISE